MTRETESDTEPGRATQTVMPVLEEAATVSTREVVTGRVRVSTRTEVVDDVARAGLGWLAVEVTRVGVGTVVDRAPPVRTEGDTTIIPVLEEVLVVEKKLVLKEELRVRRSTVEDVVETPVTLRRQRAVVERYDQAGQPSNEEDQR